MITTLKMTKSEIQLKRVAMTLTTDESADILVDSEVVDCLDMGHSFLYKLRHPALGLLAMVNTSVGLCGLLPI